MINIFQKHQIIDQELDFKIKCDSQSLSFYCDIESFISDHIPGIRAVSVLDVGARTASGTALLRAIHHPRSFARLKFHEVTALDLDVKSIEKARNEFPDIEYMTVDIGKLKGVRKWNLVLSSHTIEHVQDPDSFVRSLEDVSDYCVIIACPFLEENLIPGHHHRFNIDFFEKRGFSFTRIYRSMHWHGGVACISIKFIR